MGGGVSRADNSVWLIFYFRSVVSRFYQFDSASSAYSSSAFNLIYNIRLLGICLLFFWLSLGSETRLAIVELRAAMGEGANGELH